MTSDIAYWFSLPNGVHIPVMKDESKMKAVGRFIKGKYGKDWQAVKRNKKTIKGRAMTAEEIQDERLRVAEEKFPKVRKALAKDLKNTFEVGRGKEKYIRLDGRRKTTEEEIDKKAKNIALKNALWNVDSKYGRYASNESKQANISYRKDYIGPSKYKLKGDKAMSKSEKAIWNNALKTAKALVDKNTDINALAEKIYRRSKNTKKNDAAYKRATRNDRKRSYGDTSGSRNTYRS